MSHAAKVPIPPVYTNYQHEITVAVVNFNPVWGDKPAATIDKPLAADYIVYN